MEREMSDTKPPYKKFDHDEFARTRAPDDFWGQIRRTVQGKPVSDEQIGMIVDAVTTRLDLKGDDKLLDLACGNGALSKLFFGRCTEYLGVDFSEYLISVAKKHFEALPRYRFEMQDVAEYVRLEPRPERFTKALCYGSFAYFPDPAASEVLRLLFERFRNVQSIFIGNLPDKDKAQAFYGDNAPTTEELADSSSQIGIWRTREEFSAMARDAGWKATFSTMPDAYYSSYYRYDALLSR